MGYEELLCGCYGNIQSIVDSGNSIGIKIRKSIDLDLQLLTGSDLDHELVLNDPTDVVPVVTGLRLCQNELLGSRPLRLRVKGEKLSSNVGTVGDGQSNDNVIGCGPDVE